MQCLNCGKKVNNYDLQRWFVNPTKMIVATSYFLCEEHKDLVYKFDDVYEIKDNIPVRKKDIDHGSIRERIVGDLKHKYTMD